MNEDNGLKDLLLSFDENFIKKYEERIKVSIDNINNLKKMFTSVLQKTYQVELRRLDEHISKANQSGLAALDSLKENREQARLALKTACDEEYEAYGDCIATGPLWEAFFPGDEED